MRENYKTIYAGGEGEITEKKSRFIATVRLVEKEEDALAFIEEMKKKYWDARHNCYAYSIGEHREFTRCSDDGEPSGTAGRPMLDVILGEDFWRCAPWYRRTCASLFRSSAGWPGGEYGDREAPWDFIGTDCRLHGYRQAAVYCSRESASGP